MTNDDELSARMLALEDVLTAVVSALPGPSPRRTALDGLSPSEVFHRNLRRQRAQAGNVGIRRLAGYTTTLDGILNSASNEPVRRIVNK